MQCKGMCEREVDAVDREIATHRLHPPPPLLLLLLLHGLLTSEASAGPLTGVSAASASSREGDGAKKMMRTPGNTE